MSSPVDFPRFMIAAASSGSGKTSWTLGLLKALGKRGLSVQAFKAGPDYIDPGLHSLLTRTPSRNLDSRLVSPGPLRALFARAAAAADISLIEGVMGYYDCAENGKGSSASLARLLAIPTILILDVRSAGESAAAVALGFLRYRRPSMIAGFVLNRVGSDRHLRSVRRAVEAATKLPVLGSLPKDTQLVLPERHLGLLSGTENEGFPAVAERLSELMEERCDLDGLLDIARAAPPLAVQGGKTGRPGTTFPFKAPAKTERQPALDPPQKKVRIGVARDEAFRFYYQDNLDMLEAFGAELAFFSPLKDGALPEGCRGLYFGGGYPELHGETLSANTSLLGQVRAAAEEGMPIFAECGGYMYLSEAIVDAEGNRFPMAAVLKGTAAVGKKLAALGYYDASVKTGTSFCRKRSRLRGHCFRYSAIADAPEGQPALILSRSGSQDILDGAVKGEVFASYLHIHFASHPDLPQRFVRACGAYGRTQGAPHG